MSQQQKHNDTEVDTGRTMDPKIKYVTMAGLQ